jgi:iron complex transport system permease protein
MPEAEIRRETAPRPARPSDAFAFGMVAFIGLALLTVTCLLSLALGARSVPMTTAIDALFSYDASLAEHIAIHDYRLPRTALGLLCGTAFGVAGALIQATTRNPLADPGILGVNAGAALLVTVAVGLLGLQSVTAYLCFAFLGAILATIAVYALAAQGRDGATPVRLVLAGVALSAVLGGIGSSITLFNPLAFDGMRTWSLGSLAGRSMDVVVAITPFILTGLVLAGMASRALNAIALGDDLAHSLGTGVLRTRMMAAIAIMLLAGGATAGVGPIGFLGLMVPHVVRWIVGPDQRRIIAGTMILAPVLLLGSDILGRFVLASGELEAGIVTAFLGAPALIVLARRKKAGGL